MPSQLYYASFLVGNAQTYVADRYYGNPPTGEPSTDFRIVDSLRAVFPPTGDEQHRCVANDAGPGSPRNLKTTLNSHQVAQTGHDDFVVLAHDIRNEGGSAVSRLYAGAMADSDIGTANQNQAASDTARRCVHMRATSSANPCIGIKILEPLSFANLSAIDHDRYMYPDSCVTDGQKWRFLNGIAQRSSNRSYDWGAGVSFGPFDLTPGEARRCAFAFIGGTSVADFAANADSTQSWYDGNTGVADPERVAFDVPAARLACIPNPFSRKIRISWQILVPGRVRAQIFDVTGRIATLVDWDMETGEARATWTPENLANGVYLLRLSLPDGSEAEKLLLLR